MLSQLPFTSTSNKRSRLSALEGTFLLVRIRSRTPAQSLRVVATTGSSVLVSNCWANARPSPLEAGATSAKPWEPPTILLIEFIE
jgi:hypothetical protein